MILNHVEYSSKKHPVLEYIFNKYFDSSKKQKSILFYLSDISEGYRACAMPEPVSISNTILDLCRQDRGIDSRVPKTISKLGYDLRKKTGIDTNGKKFAGEFVLVGVGKSLDSWLSWPKVSTSVSVDSSNIPTLVRKLVRADEGGLFSIIDYCDVFTNILGEGKRVVYRIQNPMKWQPNEIDGFYASEFGDKTYIYPVEAKALTTGDAINLDQLAGGYKTVLEKMRKFEYKVTVQQIAVRMIKNGVDIAIFPANSTPIKPEKYVRVVFNPQIDNWK